MSLVGSRLFYLITQLGSVLFLFPAFLLMCYWLWTQQRKKDIPIYAIAVGGGVLINLILKSLFGRVRPDFTNAFYHEIGYSFPSGHSMMSMIFYGMTVFLLLQSIKSFSVKTAVLVGGAAIILLVGFSRLTLGVHFLSDVVGGWTAGSIWLITCIALREFTWL
jgi:undecaprenyl-diphosphatase